MISNILVPTDGSETANKAGEYAAGLAKQVGAKITILCVKNESIVFAHPYSGIASPSNIHPQINDYMQEAADACTQAIAKICKENGVLTETVTPSGHPVEEITKAAINSKVDLIVIGSHGRSALKASLLGSVAFGIISQEPKIPVLVVKR